MPIPNVTSLYARIQKGSEGGNEFARILNLLLVAESSVQKYEITTSSDSAGDYKGVDAIIKRKGENIGVQIKFYPYPFSSAHKTLIKESLKNATIKFPEMERWIVITPDNIEKNGKEWFDQISKSSKIQIDQWGHTHILELMLKHPHIGNHYYPELRNNHLKEEPTDGVSLNYFNQILNSNNDINGLFLKSQPHLHDCKLVFSKNFFWEISELYYFKYRDEISKDFSKFKNENFSYVTVNSYSLTDINELPGGMKILFEQFEALQPGITYYVVKFLDDNSKVIVSLSVWCYINGRWVFFFKPWQINREIESLKNNKRLKRIITFLKFLRFDKRTGENKKSKVYISVNYIMHKLFSSKQ